MVVKPIGEEALLTCSVIANPVEDLTFQWRFDGHLLKEETTREIKVGWSGEVEVCRICCFYCNMFNEINLPPSQTVKVGWFGLI